MPKMLKTLSKKLPDALELANALATWYRTNHRDLPWRMNRDPYRIWISEVMLQQTTVQAVIPYYERFMKQFSSVAVLANAKEEKVLEAWAGLGYYSRARNLHKAAKFIFANGFPQTAAELLALSGFGPYTSRAVASLAFGERVGVLDGNVIRVLSRVSGTAFEWWKNPERNRLQEFSDQLVIKDPPEIVNQAMMELGATVCTPQKPACLICPWMRMCEARKNNLIALLPLKKPRREVELWLWEPFVQIKTDKSGQKIAMIENDYAPFLKGHLILPGRAEKISQRPKDFHAIGGVTHHRIFIRHLLDAQSTKKLLTKKDVQWINLEHLRQKSPSSLVKKAIEIKDQRSTKPAGRR